MKPAPFEYFAPGTTEEACSLLDQHGFDAKVVAGGQSLIPAMNFRLAQPAVLIDLNRIDELSYIKQDKDTKSIRIGSMTRQRELERNEAIAKRLPLIQETMPHIAHPQIRNRGTIGGSIAHADPAAELPVLMRVLEAQFVITSAKGTRTLAAEDFFVGLFTTAMEPEEILTEIILPEMPANAGWAFTEMARRHGDYALVGVACTIGLNGSGQCENVRIGMLSVGEGPVLAQNAASYLQNRTPDEKSVQEAAEIAASQDIDPPGDIHASGDFRRHLAKVLTKRALDTALSRTGN